ncbi:MAG: TonB-dependent receptor, partial [Acidobacteriaceae bacterium]|nr:TonB-dependent receptor [Acidobacteriaceae bacterium]
KAGFEESTSTIQIKDGSVAEISLVLTPKMQHSSVEEVEKAPAVEQSASENNELRPSEVKTLPGNPPTVTETLPLVPGIVRGPQGELKIDGNNEERAALVVNQSDVTDPATGKFGPTVPVDSVETVNVLNTPFLAQYGRFTTGVVAVETRRGGEKWHAELNDPFPDFRIRSWHMRGIRNETPRAVLGGPLIANRLYFISSLTYILDKIPSRTLGFPYNESKLEWINSFSQVDYILSPRQILTATVHASPQHTNFINPDYFNPQPVTPTYAQHNYIGTIADHFGIWGGTLDSSLSIQRFDAYVGAQGSADMVLTPQGNQGNYFATQSRGAQRKEWLEIWSPSPVRALGSHQFKLGNSLTTSSDDVLFTLRPVNIVNSFGQLLQRVDFSTRPPFSRSDLEVAAYVQDHWSLNPKLAFDYGGRIEHQRLANSLRLAPRAGFAWTPFTNERTVLRAGYGQYYDHIPLDVYTFNRYPERIITNYAPDGSIIGSPIQYLNVIGSVTGPRSFFVRRQQVAGAFSPRGVTWNVQVEHQFSPLLRIRGVYTDNRSVGLIVLDPQLLGTAPRLVLNGDGSSRYRQAEVTSKVTWKSGQQLILSYTRSRAQGSINGFDSFLGNFAMPIVRPDVYSNLPGDLPNRFLIWGRVNLPLKFSMLPIVEYRNGFPYTQLDAAQNYVGTPYSSRFPNFFSADTRLVRDFRVNPKYSLRLSVTGFNLTNHWNALLVHGNTEDPQYGIFFGNYHRRYRFDFEVLF